MAGQGPSQVELIRERLIREWILDRPSVDGQIDGLGAIAAAYWAVLAPMIGTLGTRATLTRAKALAARRHPLLGRIGVVEDGLDLAGLRAELGRETPRGSGEAVSALVQELFSVLHRLLGSAIVPILREVEVELAERAGTMGSPGSSPTGEEEQ